MKNNKKIIFLLIIFIVFMSMFIIFHNNNKGKSNGNEIVLADELSLIDSSKWVAVDGLGRMVSNNIIVNPKKRYVGMFYWTWHMDNNSTYSYNVNNIMKNNPTRSHDTAWWDTNYNVKSYWWNEPIYGYYLESDDYVLRKQAELLADAGIDFIVFDCTNGSNTTKAAYENLLKVWKIAKNDGINVPKIAFMLPFTYSSESYISFMNIYNNLYSKSSSNYQKYSDLLFIYNKKPLIILDTKGAPKDMLNLLQEFEVREANITYFDSGPKEGNAKWDWLSVYPQAYYLKPNGTAEEISVGVSQNADYVRNKLTAMNGNNVMGRSYAYNDYSYSYTYRNSLIKVSNIIEGANAKSYNTSLYGRNFQQQWDYALSVDPEVVFVTGWNEWIMGRFKNWEGVTNAFPDEYNDEYSRDIEPSKGDLKDYYYYQLVSNVRKYKGANSITKQLNPITIDINKISDWNNNNIIEYNHYTGGNNRDSLGFGENYYKNDTFRNDIKKAKVAYDSQNIYFYVETVNKLTSYTDNNWMRLLIDTKDSINSREDDNWEEFEYIVNRNNIKEDKMILEKSIGGWNFKKIGEVRYTINDNVLQVEIPRGYLEMTNDNILFNFKWCDNNLTNGDIMTIYTDGDSAPGGRFAFQFSGISKYDDTQSIVDIKLKPEDIKINVGQKYQIEVITNSNALINNIIWSSSNTNIASVDENGNVKGLKEGKSIIKAVIDGREISTTITVKKNINYFIYIVIFFIIIDIVIIFIKLKRKLSI